MKVRYTPQAFADRERIIEYLAVQARTGLLDLMQVR